MINFGKKIVIVAMSLLIAGTLSAQIARGVRVPRALLSRLPVSPHTPFLSHSDAIVMQGMSPVFGGRQIAEQFPQAAQRRHDLATEFVYRQTAAQFSQTVQRRYGPMTELHKAVMRGDQDGDQKNVKELIESGSDINAPGNFGWSPLHFAIELGHIHVVRLLLDLGADVEVYDMFGQRPLHMAAARGFEEVVKLLFEKRAQGDVRTIAGSTPLFLACQNNHAGVVQLLEEFYPNTR